MIEIEPDPDFAQFLDLNCHNCRSGYGDNSRQIRVLHNRAGLKPKERELVQRLTEACQSCLKAGRPENGTITAIRSCVYRSGIKSKRQKLV